jgi:hypothetical protein
MNAFELEQIRKETINKLNLSRSSGQVLFIFYNYINIILLNKNELFISSYLKEFIEDYIISLKSFDPFYQELIFTDHILEQSAKLSGLSQLGNYTEEINTARKKIKQRRDYLISLLRGKAENASASSTGIYFPVLEDTRHLNNDITLGFAETLSITINKDPKAGEDIFLIIPSSELIEQNILEQIKISWQIAKKRAADYIPKLKCCHKVVLQFDNRTGEYIGDSLGAALVILFLQELLNYYDSAYQITATGKIAVTGGITVDGKIKPVSDKIIQMKTALIFYSDIQAFVVPDSEDIYVQEKLNNLQKEFPSRDIKIIEAKNLDDILNRRDLLDIKKRNPVLRTGHFVKKNWISLTIISLLTLLFLFFFVLDFDYNPYSLYSDSKTLYIKNINGKVLWTKALTLPSKDPNDKISRYARLLDIDGDGKNELIIANERNPETQEPIDRSRVVCYNSNNSIRWKYSFKDKVIAKREILDTDYTVFLIDTVTLSGKKSLFMRAANDRSFASAVYRIDLKTGKRLPGTFWASGHIMDGEIEYVNNKPDFVGVGLDNGYEDLCFFAYNLDTLSEVRPTKDQYLIENFPIAKMKEYIRFPKTDLDDYDELRTPALIDFSFNYVTRTKEFAFATCVNNIPEILETGYTIENNFKNIIISIGSGFRVRRDTLVAHGILNPPYTDTEEYRNIIKSKILYWTGNNWVHKRDLK